MILAGVVAPSFPAYSQGLRLEDNPRIMVYRTDKRSITERALNVIGLSQSQVGRSFALVAGVENYPSLADGDKTLPAAGEDLRKLVEYLKEEEFFDEIAKRQGREFRQSGIFLTVILSGPRFEVS